MAARRISKSSIDWVEMAKRAGEHQRAQFNAFKLKSDGYLRRVLSLPEELPKIDWSLYKQQIAIPGLVDNFQKQYESLKIPYPTDNYSATVDSLAKTNLEESKARIAAAQAEIKQAEEDLDKWNKCIPIWEMSHEEYALAFPDFVIDLVKEPFILPFDDIHEQPSYPWIDKWKKIDIEINGPPAPKVQVADH